MSTTLAQSSEAGHPSTFKMSRSWTSKFRPRHDVLFEILLSRGLPPLVVHAPGMPLRTSELGGVVNAMRQGGVLSPIRARSNGVGCYWGDLCWCPYIMMLFCWHHASALRMLLHVSHLPGVAACALIQQKHN